MIKAEVDTEEGRIFEAQLSFGFLIQGRAFGFMVMMSGGADDADGAGDDAGDDAGGGADGGGGDDGKRRR